MKTDRMTRFLMSIMLAGSCSAALAAPVIFSATGANAGAISPVVDLFRSGLGALNPNVAGSFGSGRREINWDGVPDAFAAPNYLPSNFFNANSPRGVVLSTPGTALQVSSNAGTGTPVEFGDIDPSYPGLFAAFSAQRLFAPLGSNIVDVFFFVPGTTTPAFSAGFGAVFSDVDLANLTSLQFFDLSNLSLGTYYVPASPGTNESLSFLGVRFNAGEQIGRIRISLGNAALAAGVSDTASTDLVVMDDFIYAEPSSLIPEPGVMFLLSTALVALVFSRRRCQNP